MSEIPSTIEDVRQELINQIHGMIKDSEDDWDIESVDSMLDLVMKIDTIRIRTH